ncbi:unnamed protein product [Allacma fusca]|uniref:Anoctamin n=1 Tax=Allacma fusca TaxID=39272 RepID=A0A8J2KNC1_9HEXA|nr:unnamed protein product [Allacma fusca]
MSDSKRFVYKTLFRRGSGSAGSLMRRSPRLARNIKCRKNFEAIIESVRKEPTMTGSDSQDDDNENQKLLAKSGPDKLSRGNPDGAFPPSYMVLRLSPTIQPAAVSWLAQKITGKKQDGGSELLLRCEPFSGKKRESLVLHVSASKLKFLEVAEYIEFKKKDSRGILREFTVHDLDNFLFGDVHLGNLLTTAEKQMIILHELENIRAQFDDNCVPGYPTLSLFPGQSILQVYLQEGLITSFFPLHDEAELTHLGAKWYWAFFQAQPFEDIRKYFGESIALYFSFLGFYTTSLFAPAILGIFHMFLPESAASPSMAFFCIFNLIWVTIFLEVWKRKCNELAYVWGTLRITKWEEPRANYRGVMSVDPVTGRYQAKYPWWKTMMKVYCVSLPIVLVCLLGAFWIMLYSFWAEETIIESKQRYGYKLAGFFVMLPSIVYAGLVWLMNFYYRRLANYLTEWENHRTQSQFERNRVTKLVLFEFVNNFMSLFYIAFYIQDFEMLKQQVTVMLIIMQAINHFQEALLPLVIKKSYTKLRDFLVVRYPWTIRIFGEGPTAGQKRPTENNNYSQSDDSIWSPKALGLTCLDATDPRIETSATEGEMDPYEGTFDDYLEMFIQFGYVFLFSAVYPLAAFWAIVNNVLEIRADAFKLCKVFQRPTPKRVKDIGAWQVAFEVMGGIAVMTNCALLSLSPNLRAWGPNMRPAEWLLLFVVIEHFLLALKLALRTLIPDVPNWVKIALARLEYQSRQALKHEQAFKARRQLTRRFKTIHVARNKKSTTSKLGSGLTTNSTLIKRKVASTAPEATPTISGST